VALAPRFEAYGFTEADADLVNSFRFAARRAGWRPERVEQAFEWFKSEASRMATMSAEQRIQSFSEFADAKGWQLPELEAAIGWFDSTAVVLDRGGRPELPPIPTPQEDAARSAEIMQAMRGDPAAYWKNPDLQDELYEINARASGGEPGGDAATVLPGGATNRRGEIEALMRDDPGRYWGSPEIQAEYRGVVGGTPPAAAAESNSGPGSPGAEQP